MLLYFPKDKHATPSNPPPGVHGAHALPESSCLAPCPPCISLALVQSTSRLLKPLFFSNCILSYTLLASRFTIFPVFMAPVKHFWTV